MMNPELGLWLGFAFGSFLTFLWLKMRTAKVNFISRIGIVIAILLCWFGFSFKADHYWHIGISQLSLILSVNLFYLFIIDSKENTRLKNRLNFMRSWKIFELAVFAITFMATPSYLIPFYNHPVARIVMTSLLIWQWLGIFIYSRSWEVKKLPFIFALNTIFVILFIAPITLAQMLGPEMTTVETYDLAPTLRVIPE